MKKIIKYLFVTIFFTCSLILNVNAEIAKENIDFNGTKITYNMETDKFVVNLTNYTAEYQWIKIADDGTELINALNAYEDAYAYYLTAPSTELVEAETRLEEAKQTLYIVLNPGAIDETAWQETEDYRGTIGKNEKYIKWIKVTNNEDSSVSYAFAIYQALGETETTNPDTGINPLYIVPVLLVLGSGLLFKKRRYE